MYFFLTILYQFWEMYFDQSKTCIEELILKAEGVSSLKTPVKASELSLVNNYLTVPNLY